MSGGPVFVDPTGRRARLLAAASWLLGLLFAGYLLLVAAALVAPPGSIALQIPGLGPVLPVTTAPALRTPAGPRRPQEALVRRAGTPAGAPVPSATAGTDGPTAPARGTQPVPPAQPAASPAASPQRPAPAASPPPSAGPAATPARSSGPTASPAATPGPASPAASPRGSGRPSSKPTPTPRSTRTPPGRA